MAKSKAHDGYISREVVLPSLWLRSILIASLSVDYCLGLGKPFEPNPWDISDSEDDEKDFLMASQMDKKELTQSKPQSSDLWGSPKTSAKLNLPRKDSIPKSTQKQTNWFLSVWSQCLCYHFENLVEVDECVHELKQKFTAMTDEALLF